MNAKLTTTELDLRDLVIKSLAGTADPCNARGVLIHGLEQIKVDVWAAATAYEAMGVGAGSPMFSALLGGIGARIEALEAFCDTHLDVNFTTSCEPEEGVGES
ncbi:MAG: hypothetical protein QM756_44660 [Polyangiaceae bacterium]